MSMKSRAGGEIAGKIMMPRKWTLFLCLGSFFAGMFFTNRYFEYWVSTASFKFVNFSVTLIVALTV